eukprot:scaffold1395_cov397-Prasinococcus_capsulatus_cf.AAC.11
MPETSSRMATALSGGPPGALYMTRAAHHRAWMIGTGWPPFGARMPLRWPLASLPTPHPALLTVCSCQNV